jgi:hypothetical protein
MHATENPTLEGEILGSDIPDPAAREITPGWITRNRTALLKGRAAAQTLALAAPPPARLALAAVSVAAEGLVLAADARRGVISGRDAGLRGGSLVLESAAILAATRIASAALGRHRRRIATARAVLDRLNSAPSH